MKRIFIIVLASIMTLAISAQENERNGFIGISAGPSFPLGAFGSTSYFNPESGYAKTGLDINLNFLYKFTENFGGAFVWYGNANNLNTVAINNLWRSELPGTTWSTMTDPWSVGAAMIGPLVTFPFNGIDLDIKVLAGLSVTTIPQISSVGSDGISYVYITQYEETSSAFAFGGGIGMRVNLTDWLGLTVNTDLITCTHDWVVTTDISNSFISSDFVTQPITMINTTVGIGYRIP